MTGTTRSRRLPIVTVVAFLAGTILTGCTTSRPRPEATTASSSEPVAASHPSLPRPTASSATPGTDDGEGPPAPAPPREQATVLAAHFAAAWARPHLSAATWWAEIAPLCEQGFAHSLRTTDPANLPARQITGAPVATTPSSPTSATYTITTDAGALTVTVTVLGGRWLVVGNDFTRSVR